LGQVREKQVRETIYERMGFVTREV